MRRRTTIALVGAATAALIMGAIPALAAPVDILDRGPTSAPLDEPPPRQCVPTYTPPPSVGPYHGGDATYYDDVLADPSCTGIPQERMRRKECVDGMAGMFPCRNVDLAAFVPLAEMAATWANDIWGWTDPQTDREYALIGLGNGTGFLDVTRATRPKYLGKLPTHTASSTWRDIEVVGNHAYVVSEAAGHGMQVFDLTRLRGVTEPITFTEDAWLGGFGQAHTITANPDTEFVYINGATSGVTMCSTGGGGPIMVDVNNRENPVLAGCNAQDGYTHDMQCVTYDGPDAAHVGAEICLGSNEDTITITDVTDKGDPVQLSRTTYPTASYVHQGWLTPNHRYFLSNDELDELGGAVDTTTTYMWDLTDLDDPIVMGGFDHGTTSIDHNLYIKGKYAYESNYTSGVRILGTKNLGDGNMRKAGFFDLYPVADAIDFAGTWANYPFFDSGTVVATSMEDGMFVLKPTGRIRQSLKTD